MGSRLACALVAAVTVLGLGVATAPARAQEEPAPERPIRLDLVRGPLITSSRITGLGGAYAGVAVGIDGVWRNPATLANRPEYSTDWFDYDVTLDFMVVDGDAVDFDGDGLEPGGSRSFTAVNVGFAFQLDTFALGVLVASYGYTATDSAVAEAVGAPDSTRDVAYVDVLLGLAYAADDGQWIAGGGAQITVLNVTAPDIAAGEPIELQGSALDVGILHRPRGANWRLGGRVRFGAELAPEDGPAAVVAAAFPWQISAGWSLWAAADERRAYNPRLRAPPPAWLDRRYLLLSAELVVTGATDGESLEALVAGEARPAGRHPTVSLHVGGEGEIFDDRVRARFGTYFEPGRVVRGPAGRLHLTGGVEIRLFEAIWMWKATFGFDLTPGWENVSFGVGFWK